MKTILQNILIVTLFAVLLSITSYTIYALFFQKQSNGSWILNNLNALKPLCLECDTPLDTATKKISLIVMDLGLNEDITEDAIDNLPPEITLAFSENAPQINRWIGQAKAAGHIVLMQLKSEELAFNNRLLSYFDGVLLTPHDLPMEEPEKLEEFLDYVKKKVNYVVDMRTQKEEKLLMVSKALKSDILCVDYSLSSDELIKNKTDLSSMKGIIVMPAFLIPYLHKEIEKGNLSLSALGAPPS